MILSVWFMKTAENYYLQTQVQTTMDPFPLTVSSVAVIAILIFIAILVCHYFSPKTTSWILSTKEETIRLSKNKLFNENGYLIHSGSDFLLSSSGSFKRFDSIDRDCKQIGQNTTTSPLWNIPQTNIPPQPLRPAPAPLIFEKEPDITPLEEPSFRLQMTEPRKQIVKPEEYNLNRLNSKHEFPKYQVLEPIKTTNTAIPRPITRKNGVVSNGNSINLSDAVLKMQQNDTNISSISTNPFLIRSISCEPDVAFTTSHLATITEGSQKRSTDDQFQRTIIPTTNCSKNKNPFTEDENRDAQNLSFPKPVTGNSNAPRGSISSAIFDFINSMPGYDSMSMPSDNQHHSQHQEQPQQIHTENSNNEENNKRTFFQFRTRSFSETEATEIDLRQFCSNSNPFKRKGSCNGIQKTTSEEVLSSKNGNVMFFRRRSSIGFGIGRRNSSQSSLDSDRGSLDNINLERAMSCDSVSSESSVLLADLEQPIPETTGYLCIGVDCDKNSVTDQNLEIIVHVMEAKGIVRYTHLQPFDTFIRIYLVPDQTSSVQTKVVRDSMTPSFNETFTFQMRKTRGRHSLWFHLYHCSDVHTLIGESELEIEEIVRPMTTWLTLSDVRKHNAKWGELMFSLSYLPTAERLTVVVVKARNLKYDQTHVTEAEVQGVFIKAYLLKDDKKVFKKKTSLKRKDNRPIFNESIIFSVPPYMLNGIQIRLTVMCLSGAIAVPLGHVIVGSTTTGKGLRHWHQMLSSLRKPVAMWHVLRYATSNRRNTIAKILVDQFVIHLFPYGRKPVVNSSIISILIFGFYFHTRLPLSQKTY